jgi:hypothetical protein
MIAMTWFILMLWRSERRWKPFPKAPPAPSAMEIM